MSAQAPARRQGGFPIPLVGMLLFLSSEVMFFGGLFATYFSARASFDGAWGPPPGAPELEILPVPLPITLILLTSSLTMHWAVRAIARGNPRRFRTWLLVTLGLGILFLAGQVYDYTTLGFGISDGVYGTVFYTLTGFHGAHVFGGVVGLSILTARTGQGQFSARNHVAVEAVSYYWHFVDVVWVALFTTLYLLG
ncbi:MAG: cytochrome c oxidase subunit 3 [Candidatus Limnocylindria bacterium]